MISANSLPVNIAVTVLVAVMVFVLPRVDRSVCRRLGLNLRGGVSSHPRAAALLRIRRGILYAAFGGYLAAVSYLVFFSRAATRDYQVHIALYQDLGRAVRIDLGFLAFLRVLFTEGFAAAMRHVQVETKDITQVYMNAMLFVPMGYLLPYLFSWFRARARIRPAVACFVVSLLIENLQLAFRRGFYDVDDLVSNTIGGVIGQFLFLAVAYVVTHPDWRREQAQVRQWKRNARRRTLYPFFRRMDMVRTSLLATSEDEIRAFYCERLGFRLVKQLVPLDSPDTYLLLEMGRFQMEVFCSNDPVQTLPRQNLALSVRGLDRVIRRLEENGMPVEKISEDPFTGQRRILLQGPDGVHIHILER